MSKPSSRKAARAQRREQKKQARARRGQKRDAAGLNPRLIGSPDDVAAPTVEPSNPMPVDQLRRHKTFALLERTCSELVVARERQMLALDLAAPGSDAYDQLAREVEAINDEIDELRETNDELLRRVAPLDVPDDRLAQLEQMLANAKALADAAERARSLLGAAQQLLAAIDDALDGEAGA